MMSETALMVLELAGIALLIAGLPLAFLYFKKGMGLFQKLNWTIVFLTFDLILFGVAFLHSLVFKFSTHK